MSTPAQRRIRLDPRTRAIVLLAGAACIAPLLLQLPRSLAATIATAGFGVAIFAWKRPFAAWLRVLLALALASAVFATMGVNFGRDTGCAILAAMLAIKPAETDSLRDARSLLGFALFAPFATFLLDQGPLSLALGLVAVVFVLLAMQRLSDLESGDARDATVAWRRLASVGRMLVLGLPITLAAFWLFPRLASPLWGVPDRAISRPGLSDSMTPGKWEDMLFDDTPAARVRFFGHTPSRSQMYFRGPVFTDFDGRTWSRSRYASTNAPAPVQGTAVRWDYELSLEATDQRSLVALDVPLSAPQPALIGEDRTLRVTRPLDSVTRWRMQSGSVARFGQSLRGFTRERNLSLPPGFNPRTVALARQWRQDAGANDAAIVRRALDWIRRDFAYSLETSLAGRDAVDQFLFVDKRGYCEQFSSSFVVLMRAAGIPARVVGGYAGADFNPIGEYWIVRRSDAHAWAEVWSDERGWVRVDPTAAVAPERVFDTLEDRAAAGDLLATLQPVRNVGDWLLNGWNDFVLGFNAERQRRLFRPFGLGDLDSEALLMLFSLIALLCLAATVWLLSRDLRERDPLLRAWRRLGKRYERLGLGRAPHEPALDWTQRVHEARAGGDAALRALGMRFSRWRYSTRAAAQADDGLNALLRDLRAHRP
jgi:transglutaminase-like putative cysteine protease